MAGPDRQFDPVANAALAGIRAQNRSINAIQQNTPAPQLPAQSQATRQLRQGVASASTVSPFNLALGSGGPDLPGGGGGGGGGSAPEFLPSAVTGNAPELPDPAGVFGGSITLEDLAPQNVISAVTENGPMPGNGGGGGGNGGSGDAKAETEKSSPTSSGRRSR